MIVEIAFFRLLHTLLVLASDEKKKSDHVLTNISQCGRSQFAAQLL